MSFPFILEVKDSHDLAKIGMQTSLHNCVINSVSIYSRFFAEMFRDGTDVRTDVLKYGRPQFVIGLHCWNGVNKYQQQSMPQRIHYETALHLPTERHVRV